MEINHGADGAVYRKNFHQDTIEVIISAAEPDKQVARILFTHKTTLFTGSFRGMDRQQQEECCRLLMDVVI